jgi:hypothetical protein
LKNRNGSVRECNTVLDVRNPWRNCTEVMYGHTSATEQDGKENLGENLSNVLVKA